MTVVVGRENGTESCNVATMTKIDNEDTKVTFDLPNENNKLKPGNPQWANYVKGVIANFDGEKIYNDLLCCFLFL